MDDANGEEEQIPERILRKIDSVFRHITAKEQEYESDATHIPLKRIPAALQMLDLPPTDQEVLEIFRNAAGGWGGNKDNEGVSLKDWRSVCAILLSNRTSDDSSIENNIVEGDYPLQDGTSSDLTEEKDNYAATSSPSDSEYSAQSNAKKPSPQKKGARGRKSKKTRVRIKDPSEPITLTRRQKQACREAFGLFFPDVKDEDLASQRIMIKDIVRVAELLKEKMTAEEVLEMLEAFSSSPDKSVSLHDFERMMIIAELA
ncbi:hypothetical protein CPB86DRAFT_781418 [Serendipita vermifera]|nr:hypothetical protein CPB86DRAFT_781418 [Serendipita vermifera]